jgi:opacity protein-like surface antigen
MTNHIRPCVKAGLLTTFTLVCCVFHELAYGQPAVVSLHTHAGLNLTLAPDSLAQRYDPGYAVGVGAGIRFPSPVELVLDFTYSYFALDKSTIVQTWNLGTSSPEFSGGVMSIFAGTAGVNYYTYRRERATVYVLARAGMRYVHVDEGSVIGTRAEFTIYEITRTSPAISIGAGSRFQLNPQLDFYMEASYDVTVGKDERLKLLPVRIGFVFSRLSD